MTVPRDLAVARRAHQRAYILDVLATGAVFTGTLAGLAPAFRLEPKALRLCLLELAYAGQIVVTHRRGQLTLRIERRSGGERRQPAGRA
jgi:hypothetical protein